MGLLTALSLVLAIFGETPAFESTAAESTPMNDYELRIETLTHSISEAEASTGQEEILSELYALRGINRMFAGQPDEEALADLDEALRLNPENATARMWRAECHERLGDQFSAQEDRLLLPRLKMPAATSSPTFWFEGTYPVRPMNAWLLLAAVWIVLAVINVVVGWPQKKETGSPLAPLLGASCVLAGLASLPVAILAAYAQRGDLPTTWWIVAVGGTTLSAAIVSRFLMPPVYLQQTKTKLPRVQDERFLNRVRQLAERMNVPLPLVRLWPSIDGSQRALAFAGTIHAPQLVVTDGILQRLEPAECDAIVAHELAHIANRSLWWLATPMPLGCAAAVAVLPMMPLTTSIAFGLAVHVGLKRLISRPVELDCDRRAAKAIGFRAAAGALTKIHAVHPLQNSGFLSLLIYATSTHPSCDVRMASLYDVAPPDDRPNDPPDPARLARHRTATIAALTIWATVLVGTLALSVWGSHWTGPLLWFVGVTPLTLLMIAGWKGTSVAHRRLGQKLWYLKPLLLLMGAAGGYLVIRSGVLSRPPQVDPKSSPYVSLLVVLSMMATAGGLSLWLLLTNGRRKLLRQFGVAFQVHDFRGALDLCLQSPGIVRRSHLLRYNQAVAQAYCGDVAGAIEAFEQLWIDKPKFPLTGFALCSFLLDSGRPERVLEVTKRLAKILPGDPQAAFFEASAYRAMKRLDEAEASSLRALELEPRSGPALALAAALAVDRGDIQRAEEICDLARKYSPGDVHLRIVEAEIALSRDPLDVAQAAVGRAVEAIRANPLSVLNSELRRLQGMLDDRLSPVVAENIFLR